MPTDPAGAALGAIVIPAHDEAAVIGPHLRALLEGGWARDLRVVVICNGCTDGTADLARRTARELEAAVEVVELARPGKAGALREAEQLALPFPRLYLDADVMCPGATARALLEAVSHGADLAVPTRRLDLSGAGRLARHYHRGWESLPWVQTQLAGRGAYAVSETLSPVLAALPEDLVADDRLVTTAAAPGRAVVVEDAVTIRPPDRLRDVVRVRSRVYAGNKIATAPTHDASTGRRWLMLMALARRPVRWPGIALFVGVATVAKARSRWAVRSGQLRWERDSRPEVAR